MPSMALKHITLQEPTLILWNKARSRIISAMPKMKSMTDDLALREILKKYLGGKQ